MICFSGFGVFRLYLVLIVFILILINKVILKDKDVHVLRDISFH